MQDVVEIMKESLYDKFTDDYGCVDFGRSSGMSQQKEAKRFLAALQKKSELQQKAVFEINVSVQSYKPSGFQTEQHRTCFVTGQWKVSLYRVDR